MYTLQQQAFVISVLSNNAAGQKGDPLQLEEYLLNSVDNAFSNDTFTQYIGQWNLVWGPVVWQDAANKSDRADNVMLAAQDGSGNVVVAIAGTNPNSAFDRSIEDLDVSTTVNFPSPSSTSAIAQGTQDGVSKLAAMTATTVGHLTLAQFLQKNASTSASLIIAGHSLGGALAPAFAIDLLRNQDVSQSSWQNVYVYPSAGPTAGNQDYVNLFTSLFPATGSTPTTAWNQDIVNGSDVVPMAWNDIDDIPSAYPAINNGKAPKCIEFVLTDVLQPALGSASYVPLPRVTFDNGYKSGLSAPVRGVTCEWLTQAVYQHIPAYFAEIVPELAGTLSSPIVPGIVCSLIDTWCLKHRIGTDS